jgi:Protein of unknown function (DUF4232)
VNLRLAGLAGVATLALIAGCSSGSSDGSTVGSESNPATTSPSPQPSSPTATTTVSVAPTPTKTVTAPVAAPLCKTSQLSLSLGQPNGAAGSSYTPIVFTNQGSSTCELTGYPGVSFVDANGAQLGKPTREVNGPKKKIKLVSGGTAHALLQQAEPGNYAASACQKATADRLKVYPPGSFSPLFVKDQIPICTTKKARTSVYPMASGSSG